MSQSVDIAVTSLRPECAIDYTDNSQVLTLDATETRSNLLSLPTEIRLKILTYLLVPPHRIQVPYDIEWIGAINPGSIFPRRYPVWDPWPAYHRPTGQILRTCRQLYDEGVDMLYNNNLFTITLFIGEELIPCEAFDFLGLTSLHKAFTKYPRLKQACRYAIDVIIDPLLRANHIGVKNPQPVEIAIRQIGDLCPSRLKHIQVDIKYGRHTRKTELTKNMLYDVGLLRADTATLSGMPDGFAQTLLNRITSCEPVIDLRDVFKDAATQSKDNGNWKCFGAFVRHRLMMLSAIMDWDAEQLEKLRNAINHLAPALTVTEFERLLTTLDLQPQHCP